MTLPAVSGWIIDYRTARAVFLSVNNAKISHCIGLCQAQQLKVCHSEAALFKDPAVLAAAFLSHPSCVVVPSEDSLERACSLADTPAGRNVIKGGDATIFIVAVALSLGLGVISDHFSASFSTVHTLCKASGVPSFKELEYFQAAGVV